MSDTLLDTDDAEQDLFSFAALQRMGAPSSAPAVPGPPHVPPTSPTAVNLREPAPVEPAATSTPEPPDNGADREDGDDDGKDVLDRDWPRCRPKSQGRAPRRYKTVGAVPELTEEQLARSPKLRQWRERERNKLNARASRARMREAKARVAARKQKICRACFRPYPPTEKRERSPYCTERCGTAWQRIAHCFDGDAAWLYRVQEARSALARPEGRSEEAILAATHLLSFEAPDYEPYVPRPGTLQSALVRALVKLREKWAPHAAEAIRQGLADTMLRPDMLAILGPMIRREEGA